MVNNYGTAAATSNWTVTATGTTTGATPSISVHSGDAAVTSASVNAGTYALSEAGSVTAYTNGPTWVCTGTGTQGDATHITLAVGQSASCTITTTAQAPTLTLIKSVVNNYGTAAATSDVDLDQERSEQLRDSSGNQ